MSRKSKRNRHAVNQTDLRAAIQPRAKRRVRSIVIVSILLSVLAAGGMAEWKANAISSLPRTIMKSKSGQPLSPTPTAPSLSKEYIYSNGSMVATVEPVTNTAPNVSVPTGLTAQTQTTTSVLVSWTASTGTVENYEVERGTSISGSFALIQTTTSTTYTDTNVAANNVYIYRVRARDMNNNLTGYSNLDLATVWNYTDDPIVAGIGVKATHITEIRSAANAARAAVGLGAVTWVDNVVIGFAIKAQHITELRTAINEARAQIGVSAASFIDPTLVAGNSIKKEHINELRSALY